MKQLLFSLIILCLVVGCQQITNPEWKLVYRHDNDGNKLSGSKQELRDAVRKGYPIRVGFGGRSRSDTTISVEHVADAKFLTIANGEEVFAQVDPIIGQNPDLEADTVTIQFRDSLEWCIIIGTNGQSDRITTNRLKGKVQGQTSRKMTASWFALLPPSDNNKVLPLWGN